MTNKFPADVRNVRFMSVMEEPFFIYLTFVCCSFSAPTLRSVDV